ncbi:collagen alpha-1(XII) chain-like [Argonauta hians]
MSLIKLCCCVFAFSTLAFGSYIDTDALRSVLSEIERNNDGLAVRDHFQKACGGVPAEIVFILDDSRSIYPPDFVKMVNFLKNFVGIFTISPNSVRVAVVTYGDKIIRKNTFSLDKYSDEASLIEGISKVKFAPVDGSSTETGKAIKYAREKVFVFARKGIQKIGIVITDGASSAPWETEEQAKRAKSEGINMIAIGVGSRVSRDELNLIASSPSDVFEIKTYAMLEAIKKKLGMQTCKVPTTPPPLDEPCEKDIDMNFVFDSGMLGDKGTADAVKFITGSISSDDLSKGSIRFGTIAGPCKKVFGFPLNRYRTKNEILTHFDQFHQTDLAPIFTESFKEGFSADRGGRAGARKVIVLFLKGKLKDRDEVFKQAESARASGAEVFVVSLDNMMSSGDLAKIASPKPENHILTAGPGITPQMLVGSFTNKLCKRLS